ncbi:hypothetical protein GCM10010988_25740 [Cnuibacter physcomitrellae]|uniref:Uncharacterized protein n=1 Tax=Cnuibacter physcomitrellae TaxID=1619308 RepID=A0A1X9LFI6_9MICO|nr:hypothetical protein [Cnuibacter physcomitrellae]ARJ03903.1 hypothetical protein B5808_00625 [Cnuibacter physcomitrellae]GGI39772.1 hypothetical protein GCM10010988_25740 [Cnuibacter physcomitrellae]
MAIALVALMLSVTGCARRTDVDAGFCTQFAERWNSFASRGPDADAPALRDELLDFWEDSRDPDVVNDTVDEVLQLAARDLRQAFSERGLRQKDAIADLDNALGLVAQECAASGHPIAYTPAADALP